MNSYFNNKFLNIVNKILIIIFFTLILGVYFFVFMYNKMTTLILSIISILFLLIIDKIHKKTNLINKILNNKKLIISLIIFSVLIRFSFLFLSYRDVVSDEATFFWNAVDIANGTKINAKYIAVFPYLFQYIYFLGNFMKIFGTTLYHAITFNIIIDLIGSIFAYLFSKTVFNNKKSGIFFMLIWLYNPFNIMWCMKILPINIVNTMIIISLYSFAVLMKNFSKKKFIILSLILGLIIGLTNTFRPIMIIFIITIFIYFIYLAILKKYNLKRLILSFIIILIGYCGVNNIYSLVVSNATKYNVPKSGSGWSIYVGSNINSEGKWFHEPEFDAFFERDVFIPEEIHSYFFKKAVNNYKSYNFIEIFKLMGKKYRALTQDVDMYCYFLFRDSIVKPNNVTNIFIKIFKYCLSLCWIITLIVNILTIKKIKKDKFDYEMLPYLIFVIGLLLSHLLVEVSPRYFMPIMVPLMIVLIYYFNNKYLEENKEWRKKKND